MSNALDSIGRYLDNNHWLITANRAGRLCKAFNGLPRHGYERRIDYKGKAYWVARTTVNGKSAWAIREAS
jgi:hypothetical protein